MRGERNFDGWPGYDAERAEGNAERSNEREPDVDLRREHEVFADHERIDNLIAEYIAFWARLHPEHDLPVSLKHVEAVRTLGLSGIDQAIQRMQDHLASDIAELSDSWQGRFDAAIALYNQHAEVWNDFVHGRIARYAQHIVPSWHRVPYL